jgi:hypothetical protein
MWPFRRKAQAPRPQIVEAPPPEPESARTADDVLRELAATAPRRTPAGPAAGPAPAPADPNLGRCLLAEGPVTADFVRQQIAVAGKGDSYLGRLLAEVPAPREQDLLEFLATGYQAPAIDLKQCKVHVAAARSIPREIALKYKVVPIDRIGDLLCLVFAGEPNPKALEAVRRETGLRLKAFRCPPHHIEILLRRLFPRRAAPPKTVEAIPLSEQETDEADGAAESRAEARWDSIHATRGPLRATRLGRR